MGTEPLAYESELHLSGYFCNYRHFKSNLYILTPWLLDLLLTDKRQCVPILSTSIINCVINL